ncbi:hypothetical protein ACOME3_005711 [Neoechinorhynchus agilis]
MHGSAPSVQPQPQRIAQCPNKSDNASIQSVRQRPACECFTQPFHSILSAIDETESSETDKIALRQALIQLIDVWPSFATEFTIKFLVSSNSDGMAATPSGCDLVARADRLKYILSQIPDKISDRQIFLETIKQIAAAIKANIDAVNSLLILLPHEASSVPSKNAAYLTRIRLDAQKKAFVSSSRNFSGSLKSYFSTFDRDDLYIAAAQLIQQTDALLESALPSTKIECPKEDQPAGPLSSGGSGGVITGLLSSIWK